MIPLMVLDFSGYAILFERRIAILFLRSMLISISVVLFSSAIAFPLAWLFCNFQFRLKGFWILISLLPFFIAPYLMAISWIFVMGNDGWLTALSINGFRGVVFVLSVWLFPVMLLFSCNAIKTGKPYQDVAMLYQKFWPRLRFTTILLAKQGLFTGAILTFMLAFTNFSVPGALQLNVISTEIFAQFGAFYDHRQAAILSIPNLVFALLFAIILSRQFKHPKRYVVSEYSRQLRKLSTRNSWLVSLILFVVFIIILGIPVTTLAFRSGSINTIVSSFLQTWEQLLNSLIFGVLGMVIVCMLGFYFALNSRSLQKYKPFFLIFLVVPFFISGGLYAIGMIRVWNQPFLGNVVYGTGVIIILSFLRFALIAYLLISISFLKIPGSFEDIGKLSGRRRFALVSELIFPLSKRAVFGAMFILFIFCFTELDTTILIYPPGIETFPVRIFSLLHYGANEMVAALCLIQITVIILVIVVFWMWFPVIKNRGKFVIEL
nr:iron ABC transporter permease [Bacteroidota bacterium]